MMHAAFFYRLAGTLVGVKCQCGWSATMHNQKAAEKEHDLHKRSEARK